MTALAQGFALARRSPALVLALLVAALAPSILGVLPLDLSLAPHLDLRPAARGLVELPADDALLRGLLSAAPGLAGVGIAALAIATVLGVPAGWLAASFIAARAVGSPLGPGGIAARGLAASVVTLPLRLLPIAAAVLVALPLADDQTLARALPRLVGAGLIYGVGASMITVLVDFTRGIALATPDRPLLRAVNAAARAMARSLGLVTALMLGEAALGGGALVLLGTSRPFGLLGGSTLAAALGLLVLRAFCSAAFVAAGAATGAALRSA
jgi:hypothetical protein